MNRLTPSLFATGEHVPLQASGSTELISVKLSGSLVLVTLNRASKRNALNDAMVAGLQTCFTNLPNETRAVILRGEGNNFSSGLDLTSIDGELESGLRRSRAWHRAFDQIEDCQVLVIAVLHGAVIGGGLELAAAAHIRVAEDDTYYALPECTRGIFVGGGGAVRVPRLIGASRMMDMMLTGRTYNAVEGSSIGFSQYVVEKGQGLIKATELAKNISSNRRLSNFAVSYALPRIARAEPDAGLLMESLMLAATMSGDEAAKLARVFLSGTGPKAVPRPESSSDL